MHKKTNTKIKTIFIGFILFKNFCGYGYGYGYGYGCIV